MKNVIINKIRRYIFTEGQLKSEWEKKVKDLSFETATEQQLMDLAKQMLDKCSLHDIEHHLLGFGWRDEKDLEGKMIAENDSIPDTHMEVIDTTLPGMATSVMIDRVMKVECSECSFIFYLDNLTTEINRLKCPLCEGKVQAISPQTFIKKEQ